MTIEGLIISGRCDCSEWPDHLVDHYRRLSRINDLKKGTLNIQLKNAFNMPESSRVLSAEEWNGQDGVLIANCNIFGHEAAIIRTVKNEAGVGLVSKNIIEIASNVNFREIYNLSDGDKIKIEM